MCQKYVVRVGDDQSRIFVEHVAGTVKASSVKLPAVKTCSIKLNIASAGTLVGLSLCATASLCTPCGPNGPPRRSGNVALPPP